MYNKVAVSKENQDILAFDKREAEVVFKSNKNKIDTVAFSKIGYDNGFEPNFDFWWSTKVMNNSNKSKRSFNYRISALSNFPKNKYTKDNLNIYLHLNLVKLNDTSNLVLNIEEFQEKYTINDNTLDTLIFENRKGEASCTNWDCTKKVKLHLSHGIIEIEKFDGTLWKKL